MLCFACIIPVFILASTASASALELKNNSTPTPLFEPCSAKITHPSLLEVTLRKQSEQQYLVLAYTHSTRFVHIETDLKLGERTIVVGIPIQRGTLSLSHKQGGSRTKLTYTLSF